MDGAISNRGVSDCFHTRAKCAIWITQCTHERSNCDIWIMQCTHKRLNLRFSILEREKMRGSCLGTLPIKHAQSPCFLCFCTYAARGIQAEVVRSCSSAPPPPPRGQGIHTVISLRDLRDASLENTSRPSFELHILNYASRCNLAYTRSKLPSFEWSFKLCNSNDNSNCAIRMIIQIMHFALVWKQSIFPSLKALTLSLPRSPICTDVEIQ